MFQILNKKLKKNNITIVYTKSQMSNQKESHNLCNNHSVHCQNVCLSFELAGNYQNVDFNNLEIGGLISVAWTNDEHSDELHICYLKVNSFDDHVITAFDASNKFFEIPKGCCISCEKSVEKSFSVEYLDAETSNSDQENTDIDQDNTDEELSDHDSFDYLSSDHVSSEDSDESDESDDSDESSDSSDSSDDDVNEWPISASKANSVLDSNLTEENPEITQHQKLRLYAPKLNQSYSDPLNNNKDITDDIQSFEVINTEPEQQLNSNNYLKFRQFEKAMIKNKRIECPYCSKYFYRTSLIFGHIDKCYEEFTQIFINGGLNNM